MAHWPGTAADLEALQRELGTAMPPPWVPEEPFVVGAVFACGPRGVAGAGSAGDAGWAAAVAGDRSAVVTGRLGAPYTPGLLALRLGDLLERAVREVPSVPDVLLVNATGRDHPRRAGLALHLGWALDVPTIGVTTRLLHDGEGAERLPSGVWVHAAWRTDVAAARAVAAATSGRARTPAPLREARRLARTERSGAPT